MIFIPGNTPSLKNSKQISTRGGKPVLLYSKTVKKYLSGLGIQRFSSRAGVHEYKTRRNRFREHVGDFFQGVEYPCVLGMNFVRDSLRKFDVINAMQIVCDLLVAHGFIEDDDAKHLIPMPMMINGSWYSVNRDSPGVYIEIINGDIPQLEKKRQSITEKQMELF